MGKLADDMLELAVKKAAKIKPSLAGGIVGDDWMAFGTAMIGVLDTMRDHGAKTPLADLQEAAFERSFEDKKKGVQAVAYWLTDTRIWADRYTASEKNDDEARNVLQQRGLLKRKRDA